MCHAQSPGRPRLFPAFTVLPTRHQINQRWSNIHLTQLKKKATNSLFFGAVVGKKWKWKFQPGQIPAAILSRWKHNQSAISRIWMRME